MYSQHCFLDLDPIFFDGHGSVKLETRQCSTAPVNDQLKSLITLKIPRWDYRKAGGFVKNVDPQTSAEKI